MTTQDDSNDCPVRAFAKMIPLACIGQTDQTCPTPANQCQEEIAWLQSLGA